MSLIVTLPDELETRFRHLAAAAGKDAAVFAREVLEEKLRGPRTLDELLAPYRKQVADSSMTDAELDAFHEELRNEAWQARR